MVMSNEITVRCPFCKRKYNESFPNNIDWDHGIHECSCGKEFRFYNEKRSEMYI